jgi:hypothetical protein
MQHDLVRTRNALRRPCFASSRESLNLFFDERIVVNLKSEEVSLSQRVVNRSKGFVSRQILNFFRSAQFRDRLCKEKAAHNHETKSQFHLDFKPTSFRLMYESSLL